MKRKFKTKISSLKWRKGFTLVELLIVITIIGVLSAILLANFIGVRQRARDVQRKTDLRQIQSALELYRSDNGLYPATTPGVYTTPCPLSGPFPTGSAGGSTYMQRVPCDTSANASAYAPTPGAYRYTYGSSNDSRTYNLFACLENVNDQDPNIISGTNCNNGSSVRDIFRLINP